MKKIEKKSETTSVKENKQRKPAVYLFVLTSLYKLGFCLLILIGIWL